MTAPVTARRVARVADIERAGDFVIMTVDGEPERGLRFACPCGCGAIAGVRFEPGGWSWNGDRDAPTVRPSIKRGDGCRWHGWLTAGEFRPC